MPAAGIVDIMLSAPNPTSAAISATLYFLEADGILARVSNPNNNVPYVIASLSTKDGPIVVDVPPADEKTSYFGTFVNAWDTPIADVSPPGDDKGKGGKYLFLPPGYDGEVPDDTWFSDPIPTA